ncbi:hypothetical protein GTW40_18535 [Streptomyces sp. SID4985]|uniref:hypothetical protein n=1 Tax=Streptomyces sp. SID4985 TaxID=2690292 RepID=UPI0013690AAE|nr:hypothetical protein [Streptomyces sp. SID4985]MYQ47029.1 hypothetical protein [Streptomyces sp. SID4985]
MRHIRPKKSNRSLRTWVLGSAAGLALVAGGGIAAQAATAGQPHPAKSAPADPKPVPSTPGTQTSGDTDPTPVPGDANGKPYPQPVPSTPGTHASTHTDPTPVPGDANGKPYPQPVPGDANGKPYPGHTSR